MSDMKDEGFHFACSASGGFVGELWKARDDEKR